MQHLMLRPTPAVEVPFEQNMGQAIEALQTHFAEVGLLNGLVNATLDNRAEDEVAFRIQQGMDFFFGTLGCVL